MKVGVAYDDYDRVKISVEVSKAIKREFEQRTSMRFTG